MAVTVADFRANFPEFASLAQFPAPSVSFWLELGGKLLSAERWGDVFDYGLQLFVAHNLALEANAAASGQSGAPGAVIGPVTSASVDKVSYSRDAGSAMNPDDGHWNLTTYGLRYVRLMRMFGAGPVQVGVPEGATNQYYPGAWPGVVYPQQG